LLNYPFTVPFWLIMANQVGAFVLKVDAATVQVASERFADGTWTWAVDAVEVAGVTAFGFIVLAVVSAAVGYLLSSLIWRLVVTRRRAQRLRQMEARLDERLRARES
jgi:uncharacterized protein (DUF2062 family)